MKRWKILTLVLVLFLILQACEISFGDGGSSGGSNVALGVVIESPAQGAQFNMDPITIQYKATAPDGVAVVELTIDGYIINTYNTPDQSQQVVALQYSWTPTMAGSHIIRVRAQDAKGTWSSYSDVMVSVAEQQAQQQESQQVQPTNTTAPTVAPATVTPSTPYIYNVDHDVNKFYYKNGTCGPTKITISIQVSDPDKVWSVVIFTRFLDKEGEGQSKWDSGHAMSPKGDGVYSITLESSKITNYDTYDYAVFRYQFVATDKNRNEVTRSEVFEDIEYSICP
ncbi:MAG: hypothetical protein GYA18_09405 [Chloroflexi bacterium]|nr:hypothetical protein [Chloroflexota bacterium]